jgi:hypothetical protein
MSIRHNLALHQKSMLNQKGEGLAVVLFLYHRFGWLRGGHWVCMPMHYLPLTVFGSKDHRSPKSDWCCILPTTNLGLCPLYLYNVGKLRSYVLRYVLKASGLAICVVRCGTLQGLSNLIPPTHGRAKGVSEGNIVSMGEEVLIPFGTPFHDLI